MRKHSWSVLAPLDSDDQPILRGEQAVLGDNWSTLKIQIEDGCVWVTLNRPERLNAINGQMFQELEWCADALRDRKDVRVVVLTGAGRAFCAGADLLSFGQEVDVSSAHAVRDQLRFVGRIVKKWVNLEKPTIAAVNGVAVGGGCNLALMCDLVLMREDAVIGQVYTKNSMSMDMGGTYFLPRLVGRARAAEIALFGEGVPAAEAERIGLVNRCLPADQFEPTVKDWARRLAAIPGKAVEMTKIGLLRSWGMDLDTTLEWEAQGIAMAFQTEDLKEALVAFREKRPPRFTHK